MNLLVSNTYLATPYQTIRGECNFSAYDLFVLTTRLQAQTMDEKITFQWESIAEKNGSPEEVGEAYEADEVVTDDENGLLYAVEETLAVEKMYLVITDLKGQPLAQKPERMVELQEMVNKALTDNPGHCVLISNAPKGISENWWQQQISYLEMPSSYSPLYVAPNWWLDLSDIPDFTDVYEQIIVDLNQKLVKSWQKSDVSLKP